ncbi:MAG: hypothetical protein WC736_15595 [Gallionella sp.]|jgi:hypothetical protein
MSKISYLPPTTTFTPEQALQSALDFAQDDELPEVLIVGFDKEGVLLVRSSRMDLKDALWLCESLRTYILNGGEL